MSAPTLEPLAEDWQRALAIVAHPDDMEYGAAAAVGRWTGQGKLVAYCMVTSGEAGIDTMRPEQARQVREAEQVAAAVVGVNVVEFLGFPDSMVEYGLPLRRALARAVRLHRPEPWAGVRQVWAAASPNAKHAVDTTDTFEAGVASLEAHSAYLAALGDAMGNAREFLEAIGRSVGTGLGTRYAAAFEVVPIRAE